MKNQTKNPLTIVMLLSLLALFISSPSFANESDSEITEDSSTTSSSAYLSDEDETPSTISTAEEEEDMSAVNAVDSDSDI